MASLLMLEEVTALYGVAEISSLAMGDGDQPVLLTGLSPSHLETYFSHVGLQIHAQVALDRQCLDFAMRTYLGSDMPIVFPLDAGIMSGRLPFGDNYPASIRGCNHIPPGRFDELRPWPHAVLLLGYGDGFFILHDSSSFPFVKATTEQLWNCARYLREDFTRQFFGSFYAVAPRNAKLPVVECTVAREGRVELARLGLLNLARHALKALGRDIPDVIEHTRLLKMVHLSEVIETFKEQGRESESDHLLELVGKEVGTLRNLAGHDRLIWLQQIDDDGYLFWDAEMAPPLGALCTGEVARGYLLLALAWKGRSWSTVHKRGIEFRGAPTDHLPLSTCMGDNVTDGGTERCVEEAKGDEGSDSHNRDHLRKSLLSSFETCTSELSLCWPEKWRLAEKYMLMQQECELACNKLMYPSLLFNEVWHFGRYTFPVIRHEFYEAHPLVRWLHLHTLWRRLRHLRTFHHKRPKHGWIWPKSTALTRLSLLGNRRLLRRNLARRISATGTGPGTTMIAFATFFPEITSQDPHVRLEVALALKTLCRIAGELNKKHSHAVGIIEMVGGSMIDGIWPGVSTSGKARETEYVANVLHQEEALERVVDVLRLVVPEATRNGLRLALELEPGPLYVLRNLETVNGFYEIIAKESLLKDCVGLNLDIAHWHLAGIHPRMVPNSIRERILHCHATDTHKGHFMDLPPGSSNGRSYLAEWLDVLPNCFVSCELEACPNREWLEQAFDSLEAVGVR